MEAGRRQLEDTILALLAQRGPLTGSEIREALGGDTFLLWKSCMLSDIFIVRRIGKRYLRLDQKAKGYARLSPSILREFLTYSVVGRATDAAALERRAAELVADVRSISRRKRALACSVIRTVADRVRAGGHTVGDCFCVLIAGDIVYEMAHEVPRPERSTGRLVRGSDLDLVVLVDDRAPEPMVSALDEAIYQQKYRCLIDPSQREEIDYVVKRMERLREQTELDTLKKMVACKVLNESELLFGSRVLYEQARALLVERGVSSRLEQLEKAAVQSRHETEKYLLSAPQPSVAPEDLYLFYTDEESEELE